MDERLEQGSIAASLTWKNGQCELRREKNITRYRGNMRGGGGTVLGG
jgi:hypothetical protein